MSVSQVFDFSQVVGVTASINDSKPLDLSSNLRPPARTGYRVQGTGYRVQGTGYRVQGTGDRVQLPE